MDFGILYPCLIYASIFQAPSPAQDQNNWKISNFMRNNRSQVDLGAQGDSKEAQSQPNSTPASASASPAHSRKGINLLPEVVRTTLVH